MTKPSAFKPHEGCGCLMCLAEGAPPRTIPGRRVENLKKALAENNIPWPEAGLGPYTETPESKAFLEQIKRR